MIFNCPGARRVKHPEPENKKCPSCGEAVEIWTDEVQARCPKCGTMVTRPQAQSCLAWCKYAKECVGGDTYNKYMKNKKNSVKYEYQTGGG